MATGKRAARPVAQKRVVFVYTQGRYTGVHQIIGTVEAMLGGLGITELPEFFPDVPVEGGQRRSAFSLVRNRRRHIEYHELITPETSTPTFHPAQL